MKKKLKPLPMWKKPPKTIAEAKRRVIRLLRLGWCKNWYAKAVSGHDVSEYSPIAARVCLVGAISRSRSTRLLLSRVERSTDYDAEGFNDSRASVEPVIALVKKA